MGVEDFEIFKGLFGASRGSRAIQVTQVVENKNKEFLKKKETNEDREQNFEDFT
jgi:hypothetical protein